MKAIDSLNSTIKKQLGEVKAFSWQTLIGLSLFSWLVAFAVSSAVMQSFISWLGWVFFTLGVGWGTEKTKIEVWDLELYLGSWLTGALVCGIVLPRYLPGSVEFYLTLWPLLSVGIALAPQLLKYQFDLVNPWVNPTEHKAAKDLPGDRQVFINLVLFGTLLSCWLQFHFLVQDWLEEYPSLRLEDFSQSSFVIKLPTRTPPQSLGARLLGEVEPVLQEQFANQTWSEVEQWLRNLEQEKLQLWEQLQTSLLNTARQPEAEANADGGATEHEVDPEAIASLERAIERESPLWNLQAAVLPLDTPSYTVRFQAFWRGPTTLEQGYYADRTCTIRRAPIDQVTRDDGTVVDDVTAETLNGNSSIRVECQAVNDRISVSPVPEEAENGPD